MVQIWHRRHVNIYVNSFHDLYVSINIIYFIYIYKTTYNNIRHVNYKTKFYNVNDLQFKSVRKTYNSDLCVEFMKS